jgi:hypothetical protein
MQRRGERQKKQTKTMGRFDKTKMHPKEIKLNNVRVIQNDDFVPLAKHFQKMKFRSEN